MDKILIDFVPAEPDTEQPQKQSDVPQYAQFIVSLMHSRTVAHLHHLSTNSYERHVALAAYYEGIVGLVDSFAECLQGDLTETIKYIDQDCTFKLYSVPEEALLDLKAQVDSVRMTVKPSLQNILDSITALIDSTLYKLKHLR